ncbi:hypothetical protein AB0C84_44310 [Actinomadura sp. NPDC048955]|uniref:hypothetical protein n=1 Tax=Actinomadura sp. NPDC048955 TaxID=3158228 RepID=UPI0033FFD150
MEPVRQTRSGSTFTTTVMGGTGIVIEMDRQVCQTIDQAVNLDKVRWTVEVLLTLLPQSGLTGPHEGKIRHYAAEIIQELVLPAPDHSRIRALRADMLRIGEASSVGVIRALLTIPW